MSAPRENRTPETSNAQARIRDLIEEAVDAHERRALALGAAGELLEILRTRNNTSSTFMDSAGGLITETA